MTAPRIDLASLPHWPRCMTREVAAAYLGISASQFDAEVKAGIWPPGLWSGRRVRWDKEQIDEWLDIRRDATLPRGEVSDMGAAWVDS